MTHCAEPKKLEILSVTDFRLSQLLITDVNSVLGLLHCVTVTDAADILEVHAVSILTLKMEAARTSNTLEHRPQPHSATTQEQN
jgi:hypothetical protein